MKDDICWIKFFVVVFDVMFEEYVIWLKREFIDNCLCFLMFLCLVIEVFFDDVLFFFVFILMFLIFLGFVRFDFCFKFFDGWFLRGNIGLGWFFLCIVCGIK